MKKIKENPLLYVILTLLGLGSGGTIAKFGVFDPLVAPMYTIIYHQKVNNLMLDTAYLGVNNAKIKAEKEMIEEGFWKPRGAQ